MKRSLLLFTLFFLTTVLTAQTALSGKVVDVEGDGEPLPFAAVSLFKDGAFFQGTTTDLSGNYFFSNIDPGTYDVEVNYTGYPATRITDIPVLPGRTNVADVEVTNEGGVLLEEIVVTGYEVPLIEVDNTTSGQTITAAEIQRLPTRNINQLASITAGAASADEGQAITIRGSRSNATDYYIDGIRVFGPQGSLLPESDIEQLQVITGGLEARYGDVTGGIISITTKGPSSTFNVNAEAETSEGLDPYGNSLVGLAVSGPIIKRGADRAVLGYRFSGRYTYQKDDDPSAVPIIRARDDVIAELEANPVIEVDGRPFVAADFLTDESVERLDARPFESFSSINLTGKLDARLSDAIDISLTGFYTSSENQFTPNENFGETWRTYNASRNPTSERASYRGNFRFRHRLGGSGVAGSQGNNSNLIQNASYVLQFGIENNTFDLSDPIHQDRFFDYGYVGEFNIGYIPVFELSFDDVAQDFFATQADYREVLRGYDPSTSTNPILSNYNNYLGYNEEGVFNSEVYGILGVANLDESGAPLPTLDQFAAVNGRTQTLYRDSWGFHRNVGTVYNSYQYSDNDVYTFQANANFELVPGDSDKSRHSIQLGVLYEQRTNRNYNLSPTGLWTTGRQLINQHLNAVDTANRVLGTVEIENEFSGIPIVGNVVAPTIEDNAGTFYRRIREDLGIPLDQYINIDGLSPDQLSLDQFSAQELTFANLIDYVGYDYLGNEVDGSFDDFFAINPMTGNRNFTVGPNRPIYAAAYLQDKFTINNMIFRVGVRADRYDANTKVLKDPYSLYEIITAEDFHNTVGTDRPGNIGDDYRVYTVTQGGDQVQAYRQGDNWFQADGTPTNGPQEIEGIRTGLVFPRYANPLAGESPNFIKETEFTVPTSFEDYQVQFNVMPRLAFSFPISGEANFFAHYDVLVQRPPSNALATALDYYYFVERPGSPNQPFNNPALRPERTIDYEVGFKTKISKTSAITLAAYYKELRDMIQQRTYFPVPLVNQYTTFDNQDFGTVKGFSFTYDLRRTSNVTINANYTLQFADGTGSDANSQRGLTNRGNLRTLFPLNFDERHRFNLVLDYRFDSRNGTPPWLNNTGINLQGVTVSGRPYTATFIPSELGGSGTRGAINGSRRPWNFTLNGQVDRNFTIGGRSNINLYLRVSNILDRRNILGVYSVTGAADDPGFLQSSFGQDQLRSLEGGTRPVEAYLDSYQWRILNPALFSLPRRFFVGIRFGI
jgi:outer membrane receptor for ferrienterochelin and colicin